MNNIKLTPIQRDGIGKGYDYIPIDFVKKFEAEIMRDHGQTVERLAERGGLSWRELAWNISGEPFEKIKGQPEFACKKYVAWFFYKWFMEEMCNTNEAIK